MPAYSLRYYAVGDRVVIDQATHAFGEAVLFNVGTQPDVYTVSLDTSALPVGWSAYFTFNGSSYTTTDVTLAPDERAPFAVTVVPAAPARAPCP